MNLGILGGTFDPPHVGHLIVAADVSAALELDRVIFVPVAVPPHKERSDIAPAATRLAMLRAALGADVAFHVSRVELDREGPSYTVDTLRELRAQHPDDELHFVIGADQYAELATWREPHEIARLARLVVIPRGCLRPEDVDPGIEVPHTIVQTTRIELSSTEVRRRVREGLAWRHLVPAGVASLIEREGLYR